MIEADFATEFATRQESARRRWGKAATPAGFEPALAAAFVSLAAGARAIVQGGVKAYSPRLITGRVQADQALLLPNHNALVLMKRTVHRQGTSEDSVQNMLQIVDVGHVAAVEFDRVDVLAKLGLSAP